LQFFISKSSSATLLTSLILNIEFMSRTPEYQPGEFQWSFLLPQYWGIWVGIVFLMILAILPWAIQHRLADLLGQMAFICR